MSAAVKRAPSALMLIGLAVGAGIVGWLFLTGQDIAAAEEREILIAAIWRHVGYGVVLTPLLFAYVVWRLLAPGFKPAANRVSLLTGWLLSLAILYLAITGPVTVWTYGISLKVFDWFAIPNVIGKMPELHSIVENSHIFVARAAPWLFSLDAAALFLWPRVSSRFRGGRPQ